MKATVNGVTYEGTAEELAILAKLLDTATTVAVEETAKEKPEAKPANGHATATRHAIKAMEKAGFNVTSYTRGNWVWLKDVNGANRSDKFKAVKLAQGWQYSIKRGQFYRVFE